MPIKMDDLKSDDMFNIELDPALLISYGLDPLNLESIQNDIFELPEETPKKCHHSESCHAHFSKNKFAGTYNLKNRNALEDELSTSELKIENHQRNENRKEKDINGNENPSSFEHLNQLFDKLELSDSENIKIEQFDFYEDKVELPDSENIKVEPFDSDEDKVELPESETIKVESFDFDEDKIELPDSKNIKVESFDFDEDKVEVPDSKNIKVESFDFDEDKVEVLDPKNIKVETFDFDEDKVELSGLNKDKAELSDSDDDDDVELSDSDNEEANEDSTKFQERGPVKKQSQAKKNRDQNNILNKNQRNTDTSEFNAQALKFLSGSSRVEFNEPNTSDNIFHPNLTSLITGSDSVPTSSTQDYFYGDAGAKAVGSPESGYESSSAWSGSSSPPLLHFSTSYTLDIVPESVDEQNILEFLVENTADSALLDNNLPACHLDGRDDESKRKKIIEIIDDLKRASDEISESTRITTSSDNIHEVVPLVNKARDLNISSLPVPSSPVLKNIEIPKRLVYKLNDKAKKRLREFLSVEEFYAAKQRIYKRINETPKGRDIKVIHVEDERDKTSENRTNLHHAVLDSRIEDIYCLVEIHKQYNKPLTDINIRDKFGKTALDYAIQNKMTLVVDYLKENTACQSVII